MKQLRLAPLLLLTALVAVACSKEDEISAVTTATNPLLAYVPADTPYLFANLEPVPAAVVDVYLARAEPFLSEAQAHLDEFQADLESGHAEVDESFADVAKAVLAELDGKLNRQGLESLGFSLESLNAIYGNGLFPVARLGLGDPQALRDTIARIETASGVNIPEHQAGGTSYWKIKDEEEGISAYIAILDDHVALSVAPEAAEAEFLPTFLGQNFPPDSMAGNSDLAKLNSDKGYLPYGSGFLDLQRSADEMLNPNSRTTSYLAALGEYDPAQVDPVCAEEARLVTSFVPRMTSGVNELTADALGVSYELEIEKSLAGELTGLVADVAPASSNPDYMLAAAMGIRVGALREFLLDKATAMSARPFQCEQLQHFNQQVNQAAVSLNQPMPPFIGNLKGFRAVLESFDPNTMDPESTRGLLSLEVTSPQMVIGMASMMVPGFEELNIEPGGDPVRIPQELMAISTPELEVQAVMSNDAIGLSVGKGMSQGLLDFMEQDGDPDGVFLSIDYDMAAMAELEQATAGQFADGQADRHEAQRELIEAYKAMMGRARAEFSFTEDGLLIYSHMTFK